MRTFWAREHSVVEMSPVWAGTREGDGWAGAEIYAELAGRGLGRTQIIADCEY